MTNFEEETVAALHNFFASVEALQHITISDLLKPGVYLHYEQILQEAYDALITVEDALTTLGMKLEYQHYRLGGALDELKPLLMQPHSKADTVLEEFHK